MKKKLYRNIVLSLIVLILVIIFTSCTKTNFGHECRWNKCPYKGITKDIWDQKVYEYVGERGINAYNVDILHLTHPMDDYDELENKLFKNLNL